MKKLPIVLNTPARVVIAVGLIVLVGEFLIMLLIESIHTTALQVGFLGNVAWKFVDPLMLAAIVAPALYLLIFRALNQQAELERQLDELRRFQKLTIGRELRMKELVEEIAALRDPLSAGSAGDIPVTSGSLEAPRHAAAQHVTTPPIEESQRSALLFMLEDLEAGRKKIEHAHQEWIAALDVVSDPIFLHDQQFRILRCNRAYQQRAGIPFKQIIGQLYYEVFPKTDAPLPVCLRAMEKATEDGEEEEVLVGEAIYRSRGFSIHDEQGAYLYSVHTLEDITESRRTEAAFRTLVETAVANVGAAFFHETVRSLSTWLGAECVIVGELEDENRVRALAMQLDGKAVEHYEYALLGTPCDNVASKGYCEYPEGICQLFPSDKDLLDMGAEAYVGMPIQGKNGNTIGVLCAIFRHKIVPQPMLKGVFEVIAARAGAEIERKRAEAAIQHTNRALENMVAKYHTMFELSSDAIMLLDEKGFFDCNPATLRMFGCTTRGDFISKHPAELSPPTQPGGEDSVSLANQRIATAFKNGSNLFEWMHRRLDGSEFPAEVLLTALKLDGKPVLQATVRDITQRKQAEVALRNSEIRLQTIVENLTEGIAVSDLDGQLLHFNRAALDLHGFTTLDECRQHLTKFADTFKLSAMDGTVLSLDQWPLARVLRGEELHNLEVYVWHIQAGWKRIYNYGGTLVRDADGQPLMAIVTISDITERKQAEATIQHANRALATLSAVNRELVHATVEEELLRAICQAVVEQRGYRLAWVGYVQHDESKSIKIMARAGHDEGYLDAMQLTWAESERGMGSSGRAIRSGAAQLCQDIANDPRCLPWHDAARQHGYASSIVLPLLDGDNTVFGILNVYAAEANAFTPNEIDLLEQMAGDLAFGVLTLQTRHERDLALVKNQEQLVQLQDSLEDTMLAIARIVEMRDPYTAGHQVRVADLAAAIARQMGLPDEQVHAIHLAGTVHDLGKIQIPAEILSKPGKISDAEFTLIKIHPQAGYDILKDIDFPWPLAQMVLQHHERLDGSGYPQGLKGDAILLEARILSVADVVEAISAHRPYRPGLGIEVALEEISKQRGVYYDSRVVDACLVVFREQGYAFKI